MDFATFALCIPRVSEHEAFFSELIINFLMKQNFSDQVSEHSNYSQLFLQEIFSSLQILTVAKAKRKLSYGNFKWELQIISIKLSKL